MRIGRTDSVLLLPPRESADGPRVSVIMPTYRRPHHLSESIRSLLNGEFQDFELLVRDDGDGSDGTDLAVLTAAAGDVRVRYSRNATNLGVANNLNSGIRKSRGELIAVCHDHDLYRSGFLRAMVNALDRYPSALYVHCASETMGTEGGRASLNVHDFSELTAGTEWLRFMLTTPHCPVCALTLVRRSAHERYGLYNPKDGFVTDVDMWMRLSTRGDVAYVREPYLLLRQRELDHQAHSNFGSITRTLARIHFRYVATAHTGAQRAKAQLRIHYWRNQLLLLGAAHRLKSTSGRLLRARRSEVDFVSSNRESRGLT